MLTLEDLFDLHIAPMVRQLLDPAARIPGTDQRPTSFWWPIVGDDPLASTTAKVRLDELTVCDVSITIARVQATMVEQRLDRIEIRVEGLKDTA